MKAYTLLALALSTAVLPIARADGTISGKWQVHQNIAGNDSDQTCTFTQNGGELSGSCETSQGKVQIAGKVEDKKVTWSFKSEYNGTPLTVNYIGTLEASKMAGSVTVPEFGVDGEFTATQSR
jgi:hypothetical protein